MRDKVLKLTAMIYLFTSCSQRQAAPVNEKAQAKRLFECQSYIKQIKLTPEYSLDSFFISYVVAQWIDNKYGWFGNYQVNGQRKFLNIYVDPIFYDSALLKLTAFVYIEYDISLVDTVSVVYKDKKSHFFDSHTIMGYRDSLEQPWRLTELDEVFLGFNSRSLQSAKKFHEAVFLNKKEMNEKSVKVYSPDSRTATEPVKYMPCEKEFWTKSPLWQKGNRVPGHYLFETFMNSTPGNPELRPVCNIHIPDSILTLYHRR